MLINAEEPTAAEVLGRTLRKVRLGRKWSLKDFEEASKGLIKDVVLGSYERGSRSISVSKLEIIAATYEVPMSAFFAEEAKFRAMQNQERVIIDLRKLREAQKASQSEESNLLDQFTKSIINLRKDWNGEILSLRASDIAFLSMMASSPAQIFENFYLTKD
jgi:transcriptional regulator with XRE-family HTH domain